MSRCCDNCGHPAKKLHAVLTEPPPSSFGGEDTPLTRTMLYALDRDAEAEIPWGEIPSDNRDQFSYWCEACAKLVTDRPDRLPTTLL